MLVHELAHTCGWHDGDVGKGVPGDTGFFTCRD
jgi:hypothetical protein